MTIYELDADDTYSLEIQRMRIPYIKAFESSRLTDIRTDRQVTRDHFLSRDKDGSHAIGSAISQNPMLHAN